MKTGDLCILNFLVEFNHDLVDAEVIIIDENIESMEIDELARVKPWNFRCNTQMYIEKKHLILKIEEENE